MARLIRSVLLTQTKVIDGSAVVSECIWDLLVLGEGEGFAGWLLLSCWWVWLDCGAYGGVDCLVLKEGLCWQWWSADGLNAYAELLNNLFLICNRWRERVRHAHACAYTHMRVCVHTRMVRKHFPILQPKWYTWHNCVFVPSSGMLIRLDLSMYHGYSVLKIIVQVCVPVDTWLSFPCSAALALLLWWCVVSCALFGLCHPYGSCVHLL